VISYVSVRRVGLCLSSVVTHPIFAFNSFESRDFQVAWSLGSLNLEVGRDTSSSFLSSY
jgi:hypothetical protein